MKSKSRLFLISWFIFIVYGFFFNEVFTISIYVFFDIDSVDVNVQQNPTCEPVCIILLRLDDRLCIQTWLYLS